jgi:hypothetical protein
MNWSAVGVWLLFTAIGTAQNAPTFPGRTFDAASNPEGLELADLDRDGALDALYVAQPGLCLSRGDGQGGFLAPSVLVPEGSSYTLVIEDFNGDGWLDVATSHGVSGPLKWALGDGNGGLSSYQHQAGWSVGDLRGADIDGDGVQELFVLDHPLSIRVLRWQAGGFVQVGSEDIAGLELAGWALGDFDGDGWVDLALRIGYSFAQPSRLRYLFGDGTGAFPRRERSAKLEAIGYQTLALDVDGDGTDEIVTAGSDALREHRRIAANRYREELRDQLASEVWGQGDLGGDGDGDLVYIDQFGRTRVARGEAGGLAPQPTPLWSVEGGPGAARLGDLNGDGRADLVTLSDARGLTVLLADSGGALPSSSAVDAAGVHRVVAGDLNDDGALDTLGDDGARLITRLNDGNGAFTEHSTLDLPDVPSRWTLLDLDGDGDLDALIEFGFLPQILMTALNDGSGRLLDPQQHGKPVNARVLPGDFNGDGRIDLAVLGVGLRVRLGNGSGGFQAAVPTPTQALGASPAFHVADVDGDGRDDVIVGPANAPARIEVFRGGSSALLQPSVASPLAAIATHFATGDFNADGRTDLLWLAASSLSELTLAHGSGTATFTPSAILTFPPDGWNFMPNVARVDSDGRDDLWFVSYGQTATLTVGLAVITSDATGVPSLHSHFAAGPASRILSLADYSGDSRPELIAEDYHSRRLRLVRQR